MDLMNLEVHAQSQNHQKFTNTPRSIVVKSPQISFAAMMIIAVWDLAGDHSRRQQSLQFR